MLPVSIKDLNIMDKYFERLKESNDILKKQTIVEFGNYCNKIKAILSDMDKKFEDVGSSVLNYFAENFTSTAVGKLSEAAIVGIIAFAVGGS